MKLIKIPFSCVAYSSKTLSESVPDTVLGYTPKVLVSEEGILAQFDIETLERVSGDLEKINHTITNKAKQILTNNVKPLFLGEDHFITLPIMRAFVQVYPKNPGIIIFDAHPDADNSIMPQGQDDLLCGLVGQKLIKPENIILFGTRAWTKQEFDFIKANKIKYFSMKEIAAEGIHEISESLMVAAKNFSDLYISIDIDVVDPAFAPGTGCAEPGGLTSRELLFFLHRLKGMHNLKAVDLVEINPTKDINGMTSKLGARILVELS